MHHVPNIFKDFITCCFWPIFLWLAMGICAVITYWTVVISNADIRAKWKAKWGVLEYLVFMILIIATILLGPISLFCTLIWLVLLVRKAKIDGI